MLTDFPEPPAVIRKALAQLAELRRRAAGPTTDDPPKAGPPKAGQANGGQPGKPAADLAGLPRPWNPASCPAGLREAVWGWCDDVAGWLNADYCWRPAQLIPACWPHHPHLARELPVLALQRWQAELAADPDPLEQWHRLTFPAFCERMAARLGDSSCRTGRHLDWPARARHAAYTGPAAVEDRQTAIYTDTHPPPGPAS